jgi:hypothetical protein
VLTPNWISGQSVTVVTDDPPFTAQDGVTLVDPDLVTCTFTCQGQTAVVFTYGVDPEMTLLSTGVYACAFDSAAYSVGIWTAYFKGRSLNGSDATHTNATSQPVPDPALQWTGGGAVLGHLVVHHHDPDLGVRGLQRPDADRDPGVPDHPLRTGERRVAGVHRP